MKLVVQVRLLPTPEQAAALEATLCAVNDAATWVAALAHHRRVFRNHDLRRHAYGQIKDDYKLAAQAAQHVIKKVTDAYATLHANVRHGNLGKPGWVATHRGKNWVGIPQWLIMNLQMGSYASGLDGPGDDGWDEQLPGPTGNTYFRARNVWVGRTRAW